MRLRHKVHPASPAELARLAFTIRPDDEDVKSCLDNPVGVPPQLLSRPSTRYEPYQSAERGCDRERECELDLKSRQRNNPPPLVTWSHPDSARSKAFVSSGSRRAYQTSMQTIHAPVSRETGRGATGTTPSLAAPQAHSRVNFKTGAKREPLGQASLPPARSGDRADTVPVLATTDC